MAFGYSSADIDLSDRASNADVSSYDLAIYGGVRTGAFIWRGALSYSARRIETARTVSIGLLSEHLTAEYDASAVSIEAEVARPFTSEHSRYEPFLGFAHVSLDTDGFTERGGASALTAASANASVNFATLGRSRGA